MSADAPDRLTERAQRPEDAADAALRPQKLAEFVGQ
jgi:Holliday junction resolvasome RuvABC ATP-dependent DNA helicase subunit